MQIGAMNHPARDPLAEIAWFGEHGFDFVDFTLEPPAADPDRINPRAVRQALDRHGLGVLAHTAWFLAFGSPFANVRAACLTEFRRALEAAHQIGAAVLNVHYSRPPSFFSKEQVVEWHVEVLSRLCEEAAGVGVTIVLEHVPHGGRDGLRRHDHLEVFAPQPAAEPGFAAEGVGEGVAEGNGMALVNVSLRRRPAAIYEEPEAPPHGRNALPGMGRHQSWQ